MQHPYERVRRSAGHRPNLPPSRRWLAWVEPLKFFTATLLVPRVTTMLVRADEIPIPVLTDPRTGARFPLDLPTGPRQEKLARKYLERLSSDERCRIQFAVQSKRLTAPPVKPVYQNTQLWQDIAALVSAG